MANLVTYIKKIWKDAPSTDTPINAENLNHMEDGIYNNATAINTLNSDLDELDSDINDGIVVTNSVANASETEVRYITVPESGTYLINVNMVFVNAFASMGQFNLHSSAYGGNMLKITDDSMGNGRMLNGTLIKYLQANTRLSLRLYQTSNTTQTIDTKYAYFKIKKLK